MYEEHESNQKRRAAATIKARRDNKPETATCCWPFVGLDVGVASGGDEALDGTTAGRGGSATSSTVRSGVGAAAGAGPAAGPGAGPTSDIRAPG